MSQIFPAGALNTTALIVPDLYVQIVPPSQTLLNGVPTNVAGIVGTAPWGPVNAPVIVGGMPDYARQFGAIMPRKYDAGTAAAVAVQQGANNLRVVRVTDGTDVAASGNLQITGQTQVTYSSLWTGSLGNLITAALSNGTAANSWKVAITIPGRVPEIYDNLIGGVGFLTPTAGTGYTAVPAIVLPAPTVSGPNSAQAIATASLVVVGTPTIGAGGNGYVIGDFITLPNGVIVKVLTLTGSAIATFAIISTAGCSPGSLTAGATPANPQPQISTTGIGTAATVNLVWGIGPATVTQPGNGYTGAVTPTLLGGGAGSGGSYAAGVSIWPVLANAINNGITNLQGKSAIVTCAYNAPQVATPVAGITTLSGGSDGASAISAATLVGADTFPRKGMFALRGNGVSIAMLADADDSTQWTTQVGFGLSEGIYMIGTGPLGDTPANAVTVKAAAGIDSYAFKLCFGDWVYWNDQANSQTRLISPQAFALGALANTAPQFSSLNKQLFGIVGTQKTISQTVYSQAELQTLIGAGIDVIANPAPAGAIFAFRAGHNTSSNAVINGDTYTRLTNYIAATLAAGMGQFVGGTNLINPQLMRQAKGTIEAFLSNMQQQGQIGTTDGSVAFQVRCDIGNNPNTRTGLGYMQADVRVVYQAVNEKFLVNLEGGQSVVITRTSTQPNN